MGLQNAIVGWVVLAAGVYLALNYARKRRIKSGCGACPVGKDVKVVKESSSRLPSNRR
jgi:hypothetical protein